MPADKVAFEGQTLYVTSGTRWTAPFAGKRGYGAIVDAGDALFLLTPTGTLTVFEPSQKEFKQVASYKVREGAMCLLKRVVSAKLANG